MKIVLIVEGQTETAFIPHLRAYLDRHLRSNMPKLDPLPYDGRIPTGAKLRRVVELALNQRNRPADHVIAITDVYTGSHPPEFLDAEDAKRKMREWVGKESRFHPHAAQYDFEAWLIPYWPEIQKLAGHNKSAPSGSPEDVNHDNPPSSRLREIFRVGTCRDAYVKPRDASRILKGQDLSVAISQCAELRALVNTILTACGASPVV